MLPYLGVFCLTAFGISQLQKIKFAENKSKFLFWSIFTILIPSILGGMRAVTLGSDNLRYDSAFQVVAHMTSPGQAIVQGNLEPGYELLSFFVSRFTTNYHWLCFATEFITVAFIVFGLYYYRDKISLALGIFAYLFLYYCNCINLVRQGMALAIVFFAMRFAFEKKPIKYLIFIAIAATFHISALIGVAIYFIFMVMRGKHEIRNLVIICIVALVGVYASYYIVRLLINMHILGTKYIGYVSSGLHFSLGRTLICLPLLLVATLLYKVLSNKFESYKYLYVLLWCEIIVVQLADTFDPAYRMALYFGYASIVALPMFPKAFTQKSRPFAVGMVLLYLAIYWGYFTVANGYGFQYPVYPYITDLF